MPKERPRAGNVVDLMEALRLSVGGAAETKAPKKAAKKPRKRRPGRKEMNADADPGQGVQESGGKEAGGRPQRKSA